MRQTNLSMYLNFRELKTEDRRFGQQEYLLQIEQAPNKSFVQPQESDLPHTQELCTSIEILTNKLTL